MFHLPKGAAVYTQLAAPLTPAPNFLRSLAATGFTGSVQYTFAASQAVLLFEAGKLISATMSRGGARVSGLDALTDAFTHVVTEGGTIDVYRLSPDLTMCLHAYLQGEALYRDQELRLIDARSLLAQLKAQRLNGCVRVHTQEKSALIFYREGNGIGFFHDGSDHIETTATESQRIAGLPGAKLDVFSTRPPEQLRSYDLLEMVNVDKLWETTVKGHQEQLRKLVADAEGESRREREARLRGTTEALKALAVDGLGKLGASLVDKELPAADVLSAPGQAAFLQRFEAGAKLLAGASKVKAVVEAMRQRLAKDLLP